MNTNVPTQLNEAREFLLQNALEDGQMYSSTRLLEGWTESLLGETWLRIVKSQEREASWKERAPLHRKLNVLRTIQGALKNENSCINGNNVCRTKRI